MAKIIIEPLEKNSPIFKEGFTILYNTKKNKKELKLLFSNQILKQKEKIWHLKK